jgi:cyclic pyranopterin phosphate synthase
MNQPTEERLPAASSAEGSAATAGSGSAYLDEAGSARMVDISTKPITRREAVASCRVLLRAETTERLAAMPKGDAVAVARLAGVLAAKRTDELIPLAHTLPLDHVEVDVQPDEGGVRIVSRVVCTARTGAELEAMVACSQAALALYDMVKAVDREAVITDLRLEAKDGGRSGRYRRGAPQSDPARSDAIGRPIPDKESPPV